MHRILLIKFILLVLCNFAKAHDSEFLRADTELKETIESSISSIMYQGGLSKMPLCFRSEAIRCLFKMAPLFHNSTQMVQIMIENREYRIELEEESIDGCLYFAYVQRNSAIIELLLEDPEIRIRPTKATILKKFEEALKLSEENLGAQEALDVERIQHALFSAYPAESQVIASQIFLERIRDLGNILKLLKGSLREQVFALRGPFLRKLKNSRFLPVGAIRGARRIALDINDENLDKILYHS